MIWRSTSDSPRIFPLPNEVLEASPSSFFGGRYSPFRWFKPRSPVAKLRDFFWLYRAALVAETQRQKSRANFYWKEADIFAKGFTKKPKTLAAALKALAPADTPTPTEETEDLAPQFVRETLIDGLAAAYNALDTMDDAYAQGPRRALEMIALEGCRAGDLSRGQISELLGQSFYETEAFLKEHDCGLGVTFEEYERDAEQLREFLAR
jgi:hypothetical protein